MIYCERTDEDRMVQGFGSNLDFPFLHPIFYFHFEPLLYLIAEITD
jgi:hypothetical protein